MATNPLNAKPSYFTLFNVLVSQPLQEAGLFDGSTDILNILILEDPLGKRKQQFRPIV